MPRLLPLRGLRYTPQAGDFGKLLAPPYDVIDPDLRQRLAEASPYNAVHLELSADGYEAVAQRLSAWVRDGVIAPDPEPLLYCYEQEYSYDGRTFRRRALVIGVEAQPWEEGAVRPHEYTLQGPKEDRLRLLQATGVQFSPVFLLARDRAGALGELLARVCGSRAADVEGRSLDGDVHRIWLVPADRTTVRAIAPLITETFYVADGHHRYETAVNFKRWLAEQEGPLAEDHPARYAMAAVVPTGDPGLIVRPIHRFVPRPAPSDWRARIGPWWEVAELPASDPHALEEALSRSPATVVALGLAERPVALTLTDPSALAASVPGNRSAEWLAVPPNAAYWGLIRPIWGITEEDLQAAAVEYLHTLQDVLTRHSRESGVAFLLNPVRVDEVLQLADRGERLPQKSTFFHPKLATGLVFHPLRPELPFLRR